MTKKTKRNQKRTNNKTSKVKRRNGSLYFSDFPDFRPNLTPREMFSMGSFGGTYWRPIYSSVTQKHYKNVHRKYPFLRGIEETMMSCKEYDKQKNKYGVKVGTSLEFWEGKKWITRYHPYGWVHWYCDFYKGKRSPDDRRQIDRWKNLAGANGRFFKFLVTQIQKKKKEFKDESVSPKIRQVLQHWAYKINAKDFNNELNSRKNN